MKRILLTYFLFFSVSNVGAFDMAKYLNNTATVSNERFIREFPYINYLKAVEFTDFKTLQYHRYLIFKKRDHNDNIGDRFIYKLTEKFIQYYPIQTDLLEQKISIAEFFLKAHPNKNSSANDVYRITGYYLLGQIVRKVEKDIKNKKINVKDDRIKIIIARLNKNNVNISIEVSKVEKVLKSVKKGDYKYLGNRLSLKIKEYLYPLSIKLSLNNTVLFRGIIMMIFLMILISKITRRLIPVLLLIIMLIPYLLKGENSAITPPNVVNINPEIKLSSLNGSYKGIELFSLLNKDQKVIGQSIWMNRSKVKANYIATGSIYNKYKNLKQNKQVILASAGGFTNQKGYPLGLTIENGKVANAVLRHDRDGLILVSKKGGIRVLNLKRNKFNLPGLKKSISNPLTSLMAYSDLLNWATSHHETIFQVQLLAYSDKLLISSQKAPNQLRERRILVLFSDRLTGEIYHAIFNIEAPYNLAVITEEIFAIISSRNKKVEAILNLDVGSYNILNVFSHNGTILQNIKGPVDISTATNLLVYTKQ